MKAVIYLLCGYVSVNFNRDVVFTTVYEQSEI